MPDLWLQVSLHPEGPVTGQLSRGFLCPRANTDFVHTFHVGLHALDGEFQMLIIKFRPKCSRPNFKSKLHHNAALQTLIKEFTSYAVKLKFFNLLITKPTSQRFTLSQTNLYEDKCALPGNIQSRTFICPSLYIAMSFTSPPSTFFFFS
jgi:hypothetical protein